MRLAVVNRATDLQALGTELLGSSPSGGGSTALARLQALNPHIADLRTIVPGTVVLVPDPPSTSARPPTGASQPVGADTFDALVSAISDGLASAAKRMDSGLAGMKTVQGDVQAAVKTDLVRRAVAADPLLKRQLADASKQIGLDQGQAQVGIAAIKAMQEGATAELALLRRLLG
jgi:hypothetical protein